MKNHPAILFIFALLVSVVSAQPNGHPIGQILYETPDDTMGSFANGILFKDDLEKPIVDFAKPGDKMVHVSTFCIIDDIVYCTYYANTVGKQETPAEQLARFVTCPLANPQDKTYHDLCWTQTVAKAENREEILIDGKHITHLYDIVLLRKDDTTLYLAWTLALDGEYYRVYRTYDVPSKTFGDIKINDFTVNGRTVPFRTSSVTNLLKQEGVAFKPMQGDIGIMQKLSKRVENGVDYYYTGCYCGPFNCLMKSQDLVNWEFVSVPDFPDLLSSRIRMILSTDPAATNSRPSISARVPAPESKIDTRIMARPTRPRTRAAIVIQVLYSFRSITVPSSVSFASHAFLFLYAHSIPCRGE